MTDPRLAIFIFLSSAAVLILISVIAWMKRPKVGSATIFLSLCMASAAVYNFGYAMEISRSTLPEIMFWVRFQHWGIDAVAPAWLLFSLHMSGREKLVTRKRIILLFVIPVFLLLATQTLGGLNLFHIAPRIDNSDIFPVFAYDRGLVAWISVTYYTFCIATSTLLFISMRIRSAPAFRRQTDVFLLGSLIPWAVMLLYMLGETPYGLDLTPSALTVGGLLFSFGLFRYHILDIIPMARDVIFESISDGVLVLDSAGRIIDFNPCLREMLPEIGKNSIGSQALEVLNAYPELAIPITNGQTGTFEIEVNHNEKTLYYKCRVSALADWRKFPAGKIIIFSDFTQNRHLLEQLKELAAMDGLTGVYNRRYFDELAAREVYRFLRYGGALSLIMLDLDLFKDINDTYGHAAGDLALLTAAETFRETLRKTDILGRYGGEEFIVLLPETAPEAAANLAEKLRQALERAIIRFQDRSFSVTASFGVTGVVSPDSVTVEDLFTQADRTLYKAKEGGRNRVCVSPPRTI